VVRTYSRGVAALVSDTHITHTLYLLTQDGCDLLQVAQTQMLNWKAPA